MATIEEYDANQFPSVLAGTAGTAGDLAYISTGSMLTYKSASTGTGVSSAFAGVLVQNATAGSYCSINFGKAVKLEKHAAANVIEMGDMIYGTKSSNLVGTVAGGTAIGVCLVRSGSTDTYVTVKLIPAFAMGVGGFHA